MVLFLAEAEFLDFLVSNKDFDSGKALMVKKKKKPHTFFFFFFAKTDSSHIPIFFFPILGFVESWISKSLSAFGAREGSACFGTQSAHQQR